MVQDFCENQIKKKEKKGEMRVYASMGTGACHSGLYTMRLGSP